MKRIAWRFVLDLEVSRLYRSSRFVVRCVGEWLYIFWSENQSGIDVQTLGKY